MMDHNQERKKNAHWNHCQHNIVNYLIDVWKLDVSPEEVNHVIGLIEVNAFEIKVFAEKENNNDSTVELGHIINTYAQKDPWKVKIDHTQANLNKNFLISDILGFGRGVFPLLAKLSHGCVSNCRYINVGDGTVMECRATVDIKKGDQILDHYVSPMENTQKRLKALK